LSAFFGFQAKARAVRRIISGRRRLINRPIGASRSAPADQPAAKRQH